MNAILAAATVLLSQYAIRKRHRPVVIARKINMQPTLTLPRSVGRAMAERKDHDVFVVSFPKSGTHLCSFAVLLLTTGLEQLTENFHEFMPMYELNKHWKAVDEGLPAVTTKNRFGRNLERRLYFSHLLPEVLLSNATPRCRYVYVIRNVSEVVASYYTMLSSFTRDYGGFEGTLEEFTRAFVENKLMYGNYLTHLESWFEAARSDPHKRILLVKYEHLTGTKEELLGVLEQINDHIFRDCPTIGSDAPPYPTKREIEHDSPILELLSFDWMKRNANLFQSRTKMARPGDGEKFTIVNKGRGKSKLSDEAVDILRRGLARQIDQNAMRYSDEFSVFLREYVYVDGGDAARLTTEATS